MSSTFTPAAVILGAAVLIWTVIGLTGQQIGAPGANGHSAAMFLQSAPAAEPGQAEGEEVAFEADPFADPRPNNEAAAENPFGDSRAASPRRGRRAATSENSTTSSDENEAPAETSAGTEVSGVVDLSDVSPNEKRIQAALRTPLRVPLDYIGAPLKDVLNQIELDYDVPIFIDMAAFDAAVISPDQEIDLQVRGISLGAALRLMLEQVEDLTYIIENEVLLITSTDEAETKLTTRVYDVSNLGVDAEEIVERLPKVVNPDSWSVNEPESIPNETGDGDVVAFGDDAIAVLQTQRVHERVVDFLGQLYRLSERRRAQDEDYEPARDFGGRGRRGGFGGGGRFGD